jgi:hypothetical protein
MHTAIIPQALRSFFCAGSARFFSALLIIALGIATSCKDDADNGPSTDSGCRVSQETNTTQVNAGTPQGYTYKAVFKYQYDEKGNQIESTVQYNYTYNSGEKPHSTSSSSMQYDADGFLLRVVRQYNATNKEGVTSNTSANEEYTYANGRLIKQSVSSTDNGKTSSYIFQYEYDGDGKVIKFSNTYNNTSTTVTYSGNIVQKITITDAGGNVSSPFVQYNDKGLLIKAIETWGGGTDEYRYEYTAEGQMAREERYINSKPSSGSVIEYDTQETPYRHTYARPKGHPTLPSTRPSTPQIHNFARTTYLEANADASAFQTRASTLYVYDYNDKGYPTGFTQTTTTSKGAVESSSTVTYEYANCN